MILAELLETPATLPATCRECGSQLKACLVAHDDGVEDIIYCPQCRVYAGS